MANAFLQYHSTHHHRGLLPDVERLALAKEMIKTGHVDGQALWRLIPREPAQLLHGLVGVKRIREKARVEAELIAGDLLNKERVQNDEIRRRIILRIDQERAAERARVEAMSAAEKRKARRVATYQRNKSIRRLQETKRQNIDEARRMEWEEPQNIDEASRMA